MKKNEIGDGKILMKFNIKTDVFERSILQEVTREHEGAIETILRQVFDTTEKQAREALVKLGRIRPEDKEEIRKILSKYAHEDTEAYGMYMKLRK